MEKLKIEYLPLEQLKPYAKNAKIHTEEQVAQIEKSITEFGFNDPIAIWGDNTVIEGHGRLMAAQAMGLKEVPVIRLDGLTDEQRRAYTLVHNKLTLNSGFDVDLLQDELADIIDLDMGDFGFNDSLDILDDVDVGASKYTGKVNIPQYEPTGRDVDLADCLNLDKTHELIEEIEKADIPKDVAIFLKVAAYRHAIFNYRNIAEFYANAEKPVQELMERSALVIIDVEDAIANGYVKLSKTIEDILEGAEDE